MALSIKKTVVLGLLMSCGTAMAGGMTAEPAQPVNNYDGLYLGAAGGGAAFISHYTSTESLSFLTGTSTANRSGMEGIIGGGLLGYDFTLYNHFKLGLEGFITDDQLGPNTSFAVTSAVPYAAVSVNKLRYNWGFRALPGYEFSTGTVTHLILGYSRGYFNFYRNSTYSSTSTNYNANGFQTGFGIVTPLSMFDMNNLSFGVDGIFTWYGTRSGSGTGTVSSGYTYRNQSGTLEGLAALRYKFFM